MSLKTSATSPLMSETPTPPWPIATLELKYWSAYHEQFAHYIHLPTSTSHRKRSLSPSLLCIDDGRKRLHGSSWWFINACKLLQWLKIYHVNSLPSLLFSLITQDSGLTRFPRLACQPVLSHGFESYNTYMLNISRWVDRKHKLMIYRQCTRTFIDFLNSRI